MASPSQFGQGWIDDQPAVEAILDVLPMPFFGATPAGEFGDDMPDHVYLWDADRKVLGSVLPPKNQGQVGSCVSFGTNTAIRRTMLSEIANGDAEEFQDIAEEVTYAGSRVEIGGGKISGDGSVGAWAAQFVQKWGVVGRGVYGSYDLTAYSESRAKEWGRKGVPDDLEPEAKKHPVKTISQVRNAEEAKRALAAGYGIAVCSNRGFTMKRDANGICKASGSWGHCMAIDGFHVEGGKLYFHIENSWGPNAHTGPVGWGDPNTAGFWAEGSVVDGMLRQNDSWAFSAVEGFPARRLNWYL